MNLHTRFLAGLAFVAASAGLAHAGPNVQLVTVTNGVFALNTDTGQVTYCYNLQTSSMPPQSSSNCATVGALGTSAAGFSTSAAGPNMFVYAKTSGAVHHCVIAISGITPMGTCSQRTTL